MNCELYNFDKITERRGSGCYKWDNVPDDVLPMWVADMDFEAAPPIIDALRRRVEHGVFGYERVPDEYYQATIDWFARRHNWRIEREWMLYTTGVVPALSAIVRALTSPGDGVMLLTPVYNCFFTCVTNNGCHTVEVPLVVDNASGMYRIDIEAVERAAALPTTRLLILCNPHNPGGRLWNREELTDIGRICRRHDVAVVSDEIHCELAMPGNAYTPYGTLDDDLSANAVVCCSPSKCFNIAGLQAADIIVPRTDWRAAIDKAINIHETCDINPFGAEAHIAAYRHGEQWLDELNHYIKGNYDALRGHFKRELPQLTVMPLEGTYLAWVDIRATGMTSDNVTELLLERGRVQVNSGTMYGAAGEGYIRINMATQRARLLDGLNRITSTLSGLLNSTT